MHYNISEIALAMAKAHGNGSLVEAYVRRLRHMCATGVLEFTRESDAAKAAQVFSTEESCLAALLLFTGEVLEFDVNFQTAIARGARVIGQGEGLRSAVRGVAQGERWALSLKLRHPLGGERVKARFVQYDEARPNEATEELLAAYGEKLTGCVVLPLNSIFEPFAQRALA